MKGLLKFCFGLVAFLLLAVVALTIAAFLIFDPDDYRDVIADLVLEQTGRELAIEGGLSIDVLPCCSVAVERVRLSNRTGFAGDEFVRVGSARLGLRLLPLILRQEIVIGDVGLDGLELTLVRRNDGEANWEFEPQTQDQPPASEPATMDEPAALPMLTVAGVAVRDARISYRDATSGMNYLIEDFDFTADGIRIRQLMDVETSFRVTDVTAGTTLAGNLNSKALLDPDAMRITLVNLRADVDAGGRDLPKGGIAVSMQADEVVYDFNASGGNLKSLVVDLTVAGIGINVTGGGAFSVNDADLSGSLDLAPFSPRHALRELDQPPMETSDPAALSNLQGTVRWSVKRDLLRLDEIDMRLDETNISGNAQTNYSDQSETRFDITIDALELDRYLAPSEETAAEGGQADAGEATELPVETLRDLDLDGRLRIDRLIVDGLLLQNLDVVVNAVNGLIRIDPATADFYGGRYAGTMSLDVTGQQPSALVDQSLTAVQAGGLLADLADTRNIEGVLAARINAAGAGRTSDEIIETLAGDVSFDLSDGVYKGVDIWHEIRTARARLRGDPAPATTGEPQTRITALTFSGRMSDGLLTSDRMVAEIPFIRLDGNGVLNLVEQKIDYRLQANVYGEPEFADGEDLAELKNLTIPLTVRGDLASPSVGVDLADLLKETAVRKVQDLLLEKLGLEEPRAETEATGTEDTATESGEPEQSEQGDARDVLRQGLRDLFKR